MDQFTEEDLKSFVDLSDKLAGKAVLTLLAETIDDDELSKKILSMIKYNYSGYTQCTFDTMPEKLNICLSMVAKGYKTSIDLPDIKYAKDLFEKYDFLKGSAKGFWRQFVEDNNEIYQLLSDRYPHIDFTDIVVDPDNITTMYFDPNCGKRIGIFCYYVDVNGRPLYKC